MVYSVLFGVLTVYATQTLASTDFQFIASERKSSLGHYRLRVTP